MYCIVVDVVIIRIDSKLPSFLPSFPLYEAMASYC
jgi:hypothetical protein